MDRRDVLFGLLQAQPASDAEQLGREMGERVGIAGLFAFVRGFNHALARRTAARITVVIGVRTQRQGIVREGE